jgi:hypothetical protein
MFHQPNLRAYDGTRSLLGDLLDLTLDKYNRYFNLPIQSPTMDALGRRIADRMATKDSQPVAIYNREKKELILQGGKDTRVAITGPKLNINLAEEIESHDGEFINYVKIEANKKIKVNT